MAVRSQRLVNNIKYYSLGVLSSKALMLIFIPIYSYYVRTDVLGDYQYLMAIISLVIPVLYQSVWEGMFRYSIVSNDDEYKVINTTTRYAIGLSFIYTVLFALAAFVWKIKYPGYILLSGLSQVAFSYWQFAARALKENKAYAIASIVCTLVTIVLNVVLIICFKLQIEALFLSFAIGSFSGAAYLECRLKLIPNCLHSGFERELLITILKYSLPLAINSVSWWLVSSCNNIVVTKYLGASANGIMAMAQRFGSIYAIFTSIISMAWQEESFRTLKDADRDSYFNDVLALYIKALFSSVLVLIPTTYLLYGLVVFGDYRTGVGLTSILYIIAVFNALNTHFGSAFLAQGDSGTVFRTTLLAGVLTVVISVICVKPFGVAGVLYATLFSTIVSMVIRIVLLTKKMSLKINYRQLVLLFLLTIAVSFASKSIGSNHLLQAIMAVVFLVLAVLYNKSLIMTLVARVTHKGE
ncbi:MAG: polysaccharide biosynthesis C-terminal domain-containing protein [Bacteroidales bacterium]|nr:polysaccharide biosynthesis C-terminal domain-containing protein [Bacteroidales bacterium]